MTYKGIENLHLNDLNQLIEVIRVRYQEILKDLQDCRDETEVKRLQGSATEVSELLADLNEVTRG